MRILIATESFVPRVDGVSRSVEALTRHCRRRGHDALVITPGHGPHEVDGFPVVRVMGIPALYPGLVLSPIAPGLRRLVDRFAPDVVHLASPAVLCAAVLRAARRARVPAAAHFQTDIAAYARHYHAGLAAPVAWGWLRRLHNRCDANYAPTEPIAALLRGRGLRRVSISGRGVDSALFRPGRPGAVAARARWAGDGPRLLCVARLAPEKDLQRLCRLARAHPELSVLLVGTGPEEENLRRMAPPNLRLAGLLEGDVLADTYAAADLFTFPSRTETFGQVVQEAMASGLPVVGMRRGGVAELVRHGETGVLVEPGGDDFERAVLALAADAGRGAQLGRNGAAAMAERSWESVLDALIDDYAGLGRRPPAPPFILPLHPGAPPHRSVGEGAAVTPEQDAPGARPAAFFDLDRTVVHGSCFLALAAPLTRAGLVRRSVLVRAAVHQLAFAAMGASDRRLRRAAARGVGAVAGLDVRRLREVGPEAVRRGIRPIIYPAARRALAEHRARGERIIIVSSAPEELVAEVAQLLGADGHVGSRVEVADGRYTGRLLRFCHGADKADAILQLAAREGLDLLRSTAYGDSVSDAPMLAAVGRGVCVNPDRRLRRLARRHGWEVRRFRLLPRRLGHPDRVAASALRAA